MPASPHIALINSRVCLNSRLFSPDTTKHTTTAVLFSPASGLITRVDLSIRLSEFPFSPEDTTVIDARDAILAPGFLEVQTNGLRGFHFTHFSSPSAYAEQLEDVARFLPRTGVTGFYPTIPTVAPQEFQKILPCLRPRAIVDGAAVLGAHVEGPYLAPSKHGAHDPALFHTPTTSAPEAVYGPAAESDAVIKIVTLAPELPGSLDLIRELTSRGIRVSLGHSAATYDQGRQAVEAGARLLTHTCNAMAPLHHREPGLAGLVAGLMPSVGTPTDDGDDVEDEQPPAPFYSIIADGQHLHPAMAALLFRASLPSSPFSPSSPSPSLSTTSAAPHSGGRCILTTDSIELAGLPDGTYPGHAQIPFRQTKLGARVVIEGTETLIGGCATLDACVRNMLAWTSPTVEGRGGRLAEVIACVTENVVAFTGDATRGRLEAGRRADLVLLDEQGNVRETWMAGRRVYSVEASDR